MLNYIIYTRIHARARKKINYGIPSHTEDAKPQNSTRVRAYHAHACRFGVFRIRGNTSKEYTYSAAAGGQHAAAESSLLHKTLLFCGINPTFIIDFREGRKRRS